MMQNMQRILLVLAAVIALWFAISINYQEESGRLEEQWELQKTERFLTDICKKQKCSDEELWLYCSALARGTTSPEIRLEEYRREWDKSGTVYYYLISWEEISEKIMLNGGYSFEQGSVIKLTVITKNSMKKRYYDRIDGKEGI